MFWHVCTNQQSAEGQENKAAWWSYQGPYMNIRSIQHEFLLFSSNTHSWVPARNILVCVEHKQPNHEPVLTAAAMTWCYLELVASMKNSASLLTRLIVTMISLMHFLKKKWGVPVSSVASRIQTIQKLHKVQSRRVETPLPPRPTEGRSLWKLCFHVSVALMLHHFWWNCPSTVKSLSQFSGYDLKKKSCFRLCGVLTEV